MVSVGELKAKCTTQLFAVLEACSSASIDDLLYLQLKNLITMPRLRSAVFVIL